MKILINASGLVMGGGVRGGVWFIQECLKREIPVALAVSQLVFDDLMALGVRLDGVEVALFTESPARSRVARRRLRAFQETSGAAAVFTVFGPAYVTFEVPHLMGFADGWVTHSNRSVFWKTFGPNPVTLVRSALLIAYKILWLRRADAWVLETKVAADGLSRRSRVPRDRVFVVSNNCSGQFIETPLPGRNAVAPGERCARIVYFTAPYANKNIEMLPEYAINLERLLPAQDFEFVVSIDENSAIGRATLSKAVGLGVERRIKLIGRVDAKHGVEFVDSADVVMQMSNLETFSANYPEAMARMKPLLVSDFSFAREICGDAAYYASPDDPGAVAKQLSQILVDAKLRRNLVREGQESLKKFPGEEVRFKQYMDLIEVLLLSSREGGLSV